MQWTPGNISEDIEDRRDSGGGGGGASFGGLGGSGLGIGGTVILLLLSVVFKQDFLSMFSGGGPSEPTRQVQPDGRESAQSASERPEVQFVSFILDDVQNTWAKVLPTAGASYRRAKLVLFRDYTQSGCGNAESATGPFYCPADEKVYLDLGFFDELKKRFGAPGEFAQAYVIAHEFGHHVQKIIGVEAKVRRLQRSDPGEANPLSVRLELQADCFAGIWANSTQQRKMIDSGDIQAAMQAAAAVGDDRMQRMANRRVSPESFTHGSSAQRTQWFQRGLENGRVSACDTFSER